jgi:hypothetical protein
MVLVIRPFSVSDRCDGDYLHHGWNNMTCRHPRDAIARDFAGIGNNQ